MKQVFSNSELAHVWANKNQTHGRTSNGSFYFRDDVIYSYGSHFPIAAHAAKPGPVLFTTRSYSNTTAKHINLVRSATSHKEVIYCHNPKNAADGIHTGNLNSFNEEAKNSAAKLLKAKKPEIYLNEIAQQRELFNKYVEFFELKNSLSEYPFLCIQTKDGGVAATDEQKRILAEQTKKREQERIKQVKKDRKKDLVNIELWRSFDPETSHYLHLKVIENTFLRYNAVKNEIETSKGVKIPVKVAARFYEWFKKNLQNGGCDGTCEHSILNYSVSKVSAGGLVVGCHDITMDEINKIVPFLTKD